MREFPLTSDSRFADLLAHPVGRDVVDKILLFSGAPRILTKLVSPLRLRTVDRLTRWFTGPGLVDTVLGLVNSEPDLPRAAADPADTPPWWASAVFYHVYPRSFADSDGDGIGDLRGILGRLDHLSDLGVDCLWLSPIFDSPGNDTGYDIRDYRDVAAEMGTLEDLDRLIEACHSRGMRIILDLVVNHTSSEHHWFRRALAEPHSPEAGYYFFRDTGTDRPPNNWLSFFSGPAWTRTADGRWVLSLFDETQPDLNWDNPAVRREVADVVRWWLDRGVDGFRMDVINYISKEPGLPDGHPFVGRLMEFVGIEHYFYGPRLHEYLAELRREAFTRADGSTAVMIGETPGIGIETGRLLSGADRGELDLVFNFDVLDTPGHTRWDDYRYDFGYLVDFWLDYNARCGPGDRIALFVENHDNPRIVSKIAGPEAADPEVRRTVARLVATLQLTMRGTPFLYQGQELGAINEPFPGPDDLRDVESRNRYRSLLAAGRPAERAWAEVLAGTRDHARTPIRWTRDRDDSPAWLPGHEDTPGVSVEEQYDDPASVLSWYRRLLGVRGNHPALALGSVEVLHRGRTTVSYVRRHGDDAVLVELNWGTRARRRPRTVRTADGTPPARVLMATEEHPSDGVLGPGSGRISLL